MTNMHGVMKRCVCCLYSDLQRRDGDKIRCKRWSQWVNVTEACQFHEWKPFDNALVEALKPLVGGKDGRNISN